MAKARKRPRTRQPDRFAKAVAAALVESERTISDLAASAEVSRVAISEWINGSRSLKVDTLERVLKALGRLDLAVTAVKTGTPGRTRG